MTITYVIRRRTGTLLRWMALLSAVTYAEGFQIGSASSRANMLELSNAFHRRPPPLLTTSCRSTVPLLMSSEIGDEDYDSQIEEEWIQKKNSGSPNPESLFQKIVDSIKEYDDTVKRQPPFQVEDLNVLFYDTFLIINLAVSISFWVVHRMDMTRIGTAFSEGCLMSSLWIGAGLFTGAFLNSAVDGHYGSADEERGGPKGAGLLAFQTYINAVNLRLLFALVVAVIQHRPVGSAAGEQLMPLEIGFGMLLMVFWRALHSRFVPRF
jgi:hypothetical protein